MQPSELVGAAAAIAVFLLIATVIIGWLVRMAAKSQTVPNATIYEWQRGLLYYRGRFVRELGPGRYHTVFGRWIATININPVISTVGPQEALTTDCFQVKLTASVVFRVVEPRKAFEDNCAGDTLAMRSLIQLAIRDLVVGRSLDTLIAARSQLDTELHAALAGLLAARGCQIESAAVRDLILSAEVRRMFTDIERAKREALAALERARGEQAALRALANAARMLKGNPELMNLRVLQALQSSGKSGTLVLGGAPGLAAIGPQPLGEAEGRGQENLSPDPT
jgi:regulator of protease activity HflC (stomatin/prohibitin superfamily)